MRARKMLLACAVLLVGAVQAGAAVITLTNSNSIVQMDPATQQGMFYWGVQDTQYTYRNQLHQQWFWYRVGTDAEQSIDTISAPVISEQTDKTVTTSYFDSLNRFSISVTYTLLGGSPSSGASDISEQIVIHNTSGAVLPFHFYQYSDFDMAGTPGGDTIVLSRNGLTNLINQADQFDDSCIVEVVNTRNASHGEADVVPSTLIKLNDLVATDLDDNKASASGNVAWALQWDVNIAPDGSYIISKNKLLQIPEPAAMSLLALGGLSLLVRRRRR